MSSGGDFQLVRTYTDIFPPMAPNGGEYGDSDEDDGFEDVNDEHNDQQRSRPQPQRDDDDDDEAANPFTAFAAAHAKAARRRARTPDGDAAMADTDLDGGGGGGSWGNSNDDDDDDGLDGTEHDNPFSSYTDPTTANSTSRSSQHADGIDSDGEGTEGVTPPAVRPTPIKYGGSARNLVATPRTSNPTGWGAGGGAPSVNTTSNVTAAAKKRKTKKFAGVEDPLDYGAGLFTIPDAEDEDDDDNDNELFAHSLDKGPPRREKMGRRDSGDSAYMHEDASGDDDDGTSSAASDDPAPFAKYTGEEAAEDEENPFGKYAYVSKSSRRAARRKEDEELMDDLFPEETTAGGRGHGGGGGRSGDGDDGHKYNDYGGDQDEYDGLDDDDDDESPRNAKSKDSGAGTIPTGMISYRDFDDAGYELDGLNKNYEAIRAYEKRRGMLTNRQWAAVLAIVTCIFILLMIIIGLSVALASSKNKNDTSTSTVGMGDGIGGSIDGQSAARPHVVAQSYLQTYSGQDIATMESTAMIEQYEELMASYLTYYAGDGREGDGIASMEIESVAVKCTFNFQRLSSSAAKTRRHQFGGGRERRQLWRGLRRRRTQGQDLPQEVTDALDNIDNGINTLEIKKPAPGFSGDVDGSKQPGIPMPIPSEIPSCPSGMKTVRDKSKKLIGCTPVADDEKLATFSAGTISKEMVFADDENPLDELDGEAGIATATVLDAIAAQEDDSMHLEIDFTMTWSASRHRSTQDNNDEKSEKDDDTNQEDKVLHDLNNFPKRFEYFMNSERGKRQQLHDLTKVLEMEIKVISDVIERETLKNKFTDAPTSAPTPAPSVATCWFSC